MLKFFRSLRIKYLEKNNPKKYVLYALGEILLIVIGILIALKVNNWNESKSEKKIKTQYLETIIGELELDSIGLESSISFYEKEILKFNDFNKRISNTNSTIDTIIKIARNELFSPASGLGYISTGNIDALINSNYINLFNNSTRQEIIAYRTDQEMMINLKKELLERLNYLNMQLNILPSDHPVLKKFLFEGHFREQLWNSYDEIEILNMVDSRIYQHLSIYYTIQHYEIVHIEETERFLKFLRDIK